jgi:broad specificity phosphatase PhoE
MGAFFSSLSNDSEVAHEVQSNNGPIVNNNNNNNGPIPSPPDLPSDITNPYNCLIVSHNNRIQCLLKLLKTLYSIRNSNHEEKIRFQNGAIIRISLWKQKNRTQPDARDYFGQLDLVYSGQLSEIEQRSRKPYYRVGQNETSGKWRSFVSGKWNDLDFSGMRDPFHKIFGKGQFIELMSKLEGEKYDGLVFYLMRHGRAWHNVEVKEQFPNKWGIQHHGGSKAQRGGWTTLDTDLTPNGIRQAKNAGEFLNNYVITGKDKKYCPIQYVFVSDLMRAVQTAFFVCKQLTAPYSVNPVKPVKPDTYIVLPCSNESQSDGEDIGNSNNSNDIICDNPSTALGKVGNIFRRAENFPSCTVVNGEIVDTCKNYRKMLYVDSTRSEEKVEVKLDWQYYLKFNQNQMRTGSNTGVCNNTNMFEQAISIIQDSSSSSMTEGGRRSSKNKKTKGKFKGGKRLNKNITKKV